MYIYIHTEIHLNWTFNCVYCFISLCVGWKDGGVLRCTGLTGPIINLPSDLVMQQFHTT